MEIKLLTKVLEANENIANENRLLFRNKGIFTINLMGAPGSGKTSLIEKTITLLKDKISIGVIVGDVSGSIDAKRIANHKIPVIQINTENIGGQCHLDANMVKQALSSLSLEKINILFIENVGNLICPAEFELGENKKVVVASVPEGEDKPLKYPVLFQRANLVVLNKTDLINKCEFRIQQFQKNIRKINPKVRLFQISTKTGEGMTQWINWLIKNYTKLKKGEA